MRDAGFVVSVIVAVKNEACNVRHLLDSVKQQNYPQELVEIVVVDGDSKDATKEICAEYTDNVFNIAEIIQVSGVKNLRGAQINYGVSRSHGELIFFPDADMTLAEGLLEEACLLLKNPSVQALYMPEIIMGQGLFGRIRNFERSFYDATCVDAVRMVKRHVFVQVGGFDAHGVRFGPDDWDFTRRVLQKGFKTRKTCRPVYHHEESMSFSKYIAKKKQYAKTFDEYIAKWGKQDVIIRKQLGVFYRYLLVFVEHGKWKKVLAHPFLAVGVLAVKVIVGANYLIHRS